MKKLVVFFIIIAVIIVTAIVYNYNSYKNNALEIKKLNDEYESFTEGEILGTSLITLINKTIDLNRKNNVQLDENNFYIENEENSIKIEIKFQDSEEVFKMEQIAKYGSELFIKNYASASFKCINKEYHSKTNSIKYLLFEQI